MPRLFGDQALPRDQLKADKKGCLKIGPVGMGKRAFYLNSFYISRMYYVMWTDIARVYKQVAMTKGGFTGIGAFGAMSYLVVELRSGRTKRCLFKFEQKADEALSWIAQNHPEIMTRSAAAQKKLDEAAQKEALEPKKEPGEKGMSCVQTLEAAEAFLEEKPELYRRLSAAAAKKRVQDNVPPARRALGIGIFAVSAVLIAAGIPLLAASKPYAIYMILFGGAFLIFSLAGNLIPIGRNSPGRVRREWEEAVASCDAYIAGWGASAEDSPGRESAPVFPVPARYAHPVVLRRMARVIRQGRAEDAAGALERVKEDLKALNRSVKVSQEEYDEVVAVKPMFLVSEYR